jgi:hypothetical protein
VVVSRASLAASTRTLKAPSRLAASVRGALVAALDASLTNDENVSACLGQVGSYTQKLWIRVKRKAAYLPG